MTASLLLSCAPPAPIRGGSSDLGPQTDHVKSASSGTGPTPFDSRAKQTARVGTVEIQGRNCELNRLERFPEELGELKLGAPDNLPWSAPVTEPGALCFAGTRRIVAHAGTVGAIAIRLYCEDKPSLPCSAPEQYAKLLQQALGVTFVRQPGYDFADGTRLEPGGTFTFRGANAELVFDPDADLAGVEVELSLVQRSPATICHADDGFAPFMAQFLAAIEADDRDRVADGFEFPFVDRNAEPPFANRSAETNLNVATRAEFLARYEDFIRPEPQSEWPHGRPIRQKCGASGYHDLSWQEGTMRAERREGRWRWTELQALP